VGDTLEVVGAGPAGLAAAITLARAGCRVRVHEAQREVGHRFGADLQGLENWSAAGDVLESLHGSGIDTRFEHCACRRGVAFDAWDRAYELTGVAPLVYLVGRGPRQASLDRVMLEQALALGVEVRFGSRRQRLSGPGVSAIGPQATDAIAAGYHFETAMSDGFWIALDDVLAPQGYAYLLVMNGRGTVKSCMFGDFARHRIYADRSVERFRRLLGLRMSHPSYHAGGAALGNAHPAPDGPGLVAGEQAGWQDALTGFGLRYAIYSGVLAARALLESSDYAAACRRELAPARKAARVNRALYARLGNRGYRMLLRVQGWRRDSTAFLRWLYRPSPTRRLFAALFAWRLLRRPGPRASSAASRS
jgi:flavin-dependent dehydrogenase